MGWGVMELRSSYLWLNLGRLFLGHAVCFVFFFFFFVWGGGGGGGGWLLGIRDVGFRVYEGFSV